LTVQRGAGTLDCLAFRYHNLRLSSLIDRGSAGKRSSERDRILFSDEHRNAGIILVLSPHRVRRRLIMIKGASTSVMQAVKGKPSLLWLSYDQNLDYLSFAICNAG
jgi:hypothetical protein